MHAYPARGDPPLPSNYYHARRGITTFFFQFSLPESSPSSIEFGSGLARLRYEVRANVGVAWKGEKKLVTDKKQVDVVEQYEGDPVRGEAEGIIVGENGKIWMQGKVLGGFMVAGQPACIELQVKNHSSKKVILVLSYFDLRRRRLTDLSAELWPDRYLDARLVFGQPASYPEAASSDQRHRNIRQLPWSRVHHWAWR